MTKQPKKHQVYEHVQLEAEVQKIWDEAGTFVATEDTTRPKYYCLSMFPYPSGQLHMGHVRTYTLGDVISRFQRLQGKNVLHPMGWDAFGLPAENAAIKRNIPPAQWTKGNIEHMKSQMRALGFSFDWSRELATCDPDYYRWEQWFFTRMFKKSLIYKKSAWLNWDPVDQTVLANEQVVDGRGWRSDAPVERRELSQWFVRITDYAEELLEGLEHLPDWPEKIKTLQRNWIGKSRGISVTFPLEDGLEEALSVYTTRPDTLMGVTSIALAPQHPVAIKAGAADPAIQSFLDRCNQTLVAEANIAQLPKEGRSLGLNGIHPLSGKAIPIWVANFVLMEYGSGAVMSVPAHDQRDWEFAQKYQLPINQVIAPLADSDELCALDAGAFTAKGLVINSGAYDGLDYEAAFDAIATSLADKQLGEQQTNYRLRDWGLARQRYWGCPIPIIHCDSCGAVPVPDEDLPVLLPTEVEFEGKGSPLKKMPDWYQTTCPECGSPARRETDTLDTFMESSWYYARFTCSDAQDRMLDERAAYWGQVDHYVGGEEHAILHLLYARFFYKVMRDEGLVQFDEPFEKLLSIGMVLQGGTKMSKSSGDAGDPQHLLEEHGADAVRLAMMFASPPEQSFEWSQQSVEAASKWLRTRLWALVTRHLEHVADANIPAEAAIDPSRLTPAEKELRRLSHSTLAKCADDYGRRLTFNTVVAAVMSLLNHLARLTDTSPQAHALKGEALRIAVLCMSPITPHICHVLWRQLTGESIDQASWLPVDAAALEKTSVELAVQVNGKLRGRVAVAPDASEEEAVALARAEANVARFIAGKTMRKCIYVPNKVLNFVVY